jgi:hypothetical protein
MARFISVTNFSNGVLTKINVYTIVRYAPNPYRGDQFTMVEFSDGNHIVVELTMNQLDELIEVF